MYSFTRSLMEVQLARMQIGIRKVVRMTNSMEMPSTPIRYLNTPPSHSRSSTNWKSAVVGSKSTQISNDSRKVIDVVHNAT